MTRFLWAVLAVLLAAAPVRAGAGSTVPPGPTSRLAVVTRTLPNGLRIAVIEDHAAAVVQTAIWYRLGSLDERHGKTGLAHALEHMMFRGTRAISGGGLDDIGARLGAVINANTAEDYTHFYSVMPSDRLALAVHIESDRMRGLLLRQHDWLLEKGAVLSEYDGDVSQPMFTLTQKVREAAYPGSPYARTALGVRADVVAATAADLRRYYDAYYQPNNATLVVTGDVKAAAVFAYAAADFGSIPARTIPRPPSVTRTSPITTSRVEVTADNPNVLVDCAYRIPGDLDPDAAATQVFANLINSARSTFYKQLVLSKLALNYAASADTALHYGILHVVISVTPGVSPEAVQRAFERTLAQTMSAGVDPELLAAAKLANARQALYARDSVSGLGDRYGYAIGVEGHDPSVDDRAIEALDAATMDVAMKKYFTRQPVVGILRPRGVRADSDGSAQPAGGVSDDFSKRPPSGPIHLASWARDGVAKPLHLTSRVEPHVFVLANGLRLYVQEVHANPTVFVSGNIVISPAYDPPGKTGVGALAAGLLQYGSRSYDFTAQQRVADTLGADINLGFQFGAHGLAKDLDALLAVLADGERRPTFPAAYVALTRDQEISAVSQRATSPDARAERTFLRAMYLRHDPILREESVASLRAITRDDLRAYAARYIRPDRTTIVVAGDVDAQTVRAKIERAFGGWRNVGNVASPPEPPLPPTRSAVLVVRANRDTVSVRMGERAVGRLSPDFFAFNLLNGVLGADGTFDTRLMHEMREEGGLVYGVSSALSVSRTRGTFEISFNAAPRNIPAAVALVRANLRRLTLQPVSRAELTRARTKLVAGTLVDEESTQTVVERCESIARFGLDPTYYRNLAARYARYTPTDLLHVARTYIRPDALVAVYEGPVRFP